MDLLTQYTLQSRAWWVAQVQRLIAKHTVTEEGAKHGDTNERAWLKELVDLVSDTLVPEEIATYDENMRVAIILSEILALWYSRLNLAKCRSPQRPVSLRRAAYGRWHQYSHDLLDALLDERDDAAYFPEQEWDLPFAPGAKNGDFV